MAYRLLLVDDDRENLFINQKLLNASGYDVSVAENAEDAIRIVRNAKHDFALVLMDYHMPGLSGAEAVRNIKSFKPHQQILAFSMDDSRDVMRETFRAGVVDFIDKNSENEVLLSVIANYCARYDELFRTLGDDVKPNEREKLINSLGMVGKSQALFELAEQIQKIGPTYATTLILGESGTGKELVAQALHKTSERKRGPFIAVNIGAEPTALLDSSLFGHRKGAFTGAIHDHPGKFQLANKGTLFLDEVGDLGLDLQVKLLRVLQEREITPVGATRALAVDVRIIAATHKDLKQMVRDGAFREDLYYRLSSITLTVPPLRDRVQDIEPLVAYFTSKICEENGFRRSLQRRCLEVLMRYPWRGNVRELRSVVERHLIKSDSDFVRVEDLEANLYEQPQKVRPTTMDEIDQYVEGVKRKLVEDTLREAPSRAEASRRLGVAQNRLHYFINKWRLGNHQ